MSTTPATATRSEFARLQGWKPSYVTELAATGRLVLSADGKRVLVPESLERIAATRDPARLANTQRHAAARAEAMAQPQPAPESPAAEPEAHPGLGYNFQDSKAKREHYAAEREHAAYLKEAGELMERGQVIAAFSDAGATIRAALEAWANTMPPMLAGQPEAAIRTTLTEEAERLLADLAARFGKVAGAAQA